MSEPGSQNGGNARYSQYGRARRGIERSAEKDFRRPELPPAPQPRGSPPQDREEITGGLVSNGALCSRSDHFIAGVGRSDAENAAVFPEVHLRPGSSGSG